MRKTTMLSTSLGGEVEVLDYPPFSDVDRQPPTWRAL